jgi:hypothetical protein
VQGSGCRTFPFGIAFHAIDGGYHLLGLDSTLSQLHPIIGCSKLQMIFTTLQYNKRESLHMGQMDSLKKDSCSSNYTWFGARVSLMFGGLGCM